jgi:hypothetical protein
MLLGPRAAHGRRRGVRPTSHSEGTLEAHVEGGSDRSEASPTAIPQDTHSVEGVFCELRLLVILRTSPPGMSSRTRRGSG